MRFLDGPLLDPLPDPAAAFEPLAIFVGGGKPGVSNSMLSSCSEKDRASEIQLQAISAKKRRKVKSSNRNELAQSRDHMFAVVQPPITMACTLVNTS